MAAEAGISTLGVKLGYGIGSVDTAPTSFEWLERVNSIGGISLETEQIDASALEDYVSKYVQGRQDTGGTWEVTFNLSNDVVDQLNALITEYEGLTSGQKMWFEVWSPYMDNGFFVIAQVPKNIPMPEFGQNSLQTVTMSLTIEEYKGMATAVEPTTTP
jgi:hypothetical protein